MPRALKASLMGQVACWTNKRYIAISCHCNGKEQWFQNLLSHRNARSFLLKWNATRTTNLVVTNHNESALNFIVNQDRVSCLEQIVQHFETDNCFSNQSIDFYSHPTISYDLKFNKISSWTNPTSCSYVNPYFIMWAPFYATNVLYLLSECRELYLQLSYTPFQI